MKTSEAIKWIDNRMCLGRGQWTEHHQPIADEPWQAGRMAIEALQNSQWIPCSERLPSEGEYVLVTENWSGYVRMWRLQSIDNEPTWEVDGMDWYNADINEAVAWMPLPEPYREEDDDETD